MALRKLLAVAAVAAAAAVSMAGPASASGWVKSGLGKRMTSGSHLKERVLGLMDLHGKRLVRNSGTKDEHVIAKDTAILVYYTPEWYNKNADLAKTVAAFKTPYDGGLVPTQIFHLNSLALLPMPAQVKIDKKDVWCFALRPASTWDLKGRPVVQFCFADQSKKLAWERALGRFCAPPPRQWNPQQPVAFFPKYFVDQSENFNDLPQGLDWSNVMGLPKAKAKLKSQPSESLVVPELPDIANTLSKVSQDIVSFGNKENVVGKNDEELSDFGKLFQDVFEQQQKSLSLDSSVKLGKSKYVKGPLAKQLQNDYCDDEMNTEFYSTTFCNWAKIFVHQPAQPQTIFGGAVQGPGAALRDRLTKTYHTMTLKAGTVLYTTTKKKYGVKKGTHEPTVSGQGMKWFSANEPHDWARLDGMFTYRYVTTKPINFLYVPNIEFESVSGNEFSVKMGDAKLTSYASCTECEIVMAKAKFSGALKLTGWAHPYNVENHPTNRYSPTGKFHDFPKEPLPKDIKIVD